MPALIDNYSALECMEESRPKVANLRYVTEVHFPSTSSTIVSFHSKPRMNQRIFNLLKEYSQLQENWDEDSAMAPSADALNKARFLANLLEKHGQTIFHAAPGPNGEIMLDLRNNRKKRSLEIIFYSHKTVSVQFPEEERPIQETFDFLYLPNLLQWLNQK
jgi:hypothetical protein